jgi:hypothetical protein
MIQLDKPNTVISSGIENAVSFGIKQEGLAHIFSVLRNQLYSDKTLAVIREYCTNAVDAHVEAGKALLPIKVTLPSRFNLVFKVRDFGLGLTEQDIQDIYAFYGESTKRKSNAMIGQLGLGSKSAFAYGDNFVITSYTNGTKTTYNAFIDVTQIGQIAKLGSEPTDEPNGVEISIGVREDDVEDFHSKAENLFKYFKVKPEIDGADFKFEARVPIMEGKGWRVFSGTSVAVMGNIGYPLENHTKDNQIAEALTAGIEVDFNIGDLEISASREKLQYTDRTKAAVEAKLREVIKEAGEQLNKRFAACATLFDAMKLYGQVMDYGSSLYPLRGLLKKNLMFNGTSISSSRLHFQTPNDGSWNVREYSLTYRSKRVRSNQVNVIDCDEKTVVVLNDLGLRGGIPNRVHANVMAGKRVYVAYYANKDSAKFLKETGLVDANCILLSSLPKVSLATAGNSGGGAKNSKHGLSVFSFDYAASKNMTRYSSRNSDYWKPETVDVANDAGVYVIIDQFNFQTRNSGWDSPSDMRRLIERLEKLGITVPTIYGFKAKQFEKARKNAKMVSLWNWLDTTLAAYFTTNDISQKLANRIEFNNNRGSESWIRTLMAHASELTPKTSAAGTAEFLRHLECSGEAAKLDACAEFSGYVTLVKPEFTMSEIAKDFNAKYPLLKFVNFGQPNSWIATLAYINLVG